MKQEQDAIPSHCIAIPVAPVGQVRASCPPAASGAPHLGHHWAARRAMTAAAFIKPLRASCITPWPCKAASPLGRVVRPQDAWGAGPLTPTIPSLCRPQAAGPLTPAELQAIQTVVACATGEKLAWAVQGVMRHVWQQHSQPGGLPAPAAAPPGGESCAPNARAAGTRQAAGPGQGGEACAGDGGDVVAGVGPGEGVGAGAGEGPGEEAAAQQEQVFDQSTQDATQAGLPEP